MNDNQKIAFNSVVIFVRLCVVSIIGILSSRIVLDALGASDYGLYNVVGGVVAILNVLSSAMMSTTYRYLAFEIGKGETGQPNKIFNISFLIHVGFAIFILVVGLAIGIWYVNNHLVIAPGKLPDARFVLLISTITAAVSTIAIPFRGLQVAYEKFSVNAMIDIISQLVRFVAIILFVTGEGNRLRIYAVVMLATGVVSCLLYGGYCFKNYFDVVRPKLYRDFKIAREMLSFASWTLVGAVANVGKTQGSTVIINLFFGTVVNAAYAIAAQVENFIATFARSLNSAAVPQITKNFSGGDLQRSITLTTYISKYTFLLMSLVAFPVLLEMDFLLDIWLKEVPEGSDVFCKLMVLTSLLSCFGEGIPALINATGRIRAYQIVVNVSLLLGLPIGYLCYRLGCPFYTISVVYCVIVGITSFLKLYMLRRLVKFDVKQFFTISYSRILLVSFPLVIYYLLYNPVNFSIAGHVIGLVGSEIFLVAVILCLGVNKDERKVIKSYFDRFRHKTTTTNK